MTKQALFDTVVAALRAQGRQSLSPEGKCLYRAPQPDGTVLKCAAGHILPDALYHDSMEGYRINSDRCTAFKEVVGEDAMSLLVRLQVIHDTYGAEEWEAEWARVAASHGVTYTPPAA